MAYVVGSTIADAAAGAAAGATAWVGFSPNPPIFGQRPSHRYPTATNRYRAQGSDAICVAISCTSISTAVLSNLRDSWARPHGHDLMGTTSWARPHGHDLMGTTSWARPHGHGLIWNMETYTLLVFFRESTPLSEANGSLARRAQAPLFEAWNWRDSCTRVPQQCTSGCDGGYEGR